MPTDDRNIAELLAALCDETISTEEMGRLDRLIVSDAGVRRRYLEYLDLHARLSRSFHRPAGPMLGLPDISDLPPVEGSGFGIRDLHVPNLQISKSPNQQIPSLSATHYPLPTPFVGGPIFSYMAATVILGVMLLSAWAYKISHDYGSTLAANSRRLTAAGESALPPPEPIFVGRVTGMKDCRWADPQTQTYAGAFVPLGRKYALASGLMEITYRSGASVILEGPCSYEAESDRGGFLALGKLTARVESEGWRVEGEKQRPKTQDLRPKTKISKSPNLQISKSLFSVRTPIAVVTDLGTEFGVEVAANGDTTSHVFQGRVVVRAEGSGVRGQGSVKRPATAIAGVAADVVTLGAGESARVERDAKTGDARITTSIKVVTPPVFVRRIVQPPKTLDLLDVIAGGNGLGRRRERGIDPTTGMEDPLFSLGERQGDGNYHPVEWHRLIDGAFIPAAGDLVQIDSAGGVFDGFPKTAGGTWGSIWPRAAEIDPESGRKGWIYEIAAAEKFMPERRGMIGVCPNVGITFDLAAVRLRYKDARPERLRAVAGLGDRENFESPFDGRVDLWVLIDGRVKWQRTGLIRRDGPAEIDVALAPADRFLTLAATDGGDGVAADWVLFGDPVLQLKPIEEKP